MAACTAQVWQHVVMLSPKGMITTGSAATAATTITTVMNNVSKRPDAEALGFTEARPLIPQCFFYVFGRLREKNETHAIKNRWKLCPRQPRTATRTMIEF